ncbi:hypothetical protein ACLOJK_019730 [Asimina triloba]
MEMSVSPEMMRDDEVAGFREDTAVDWVTAITVGLQREGCWRRRSITTGRNRCWRWLRRAADGAHARIHGFELPVAIEEEEILSLIWDHRLVVNPLDGSDQPIVACCRWFPTSFGEDGVVIAQTVWMLLPSVELTGS